MRDLDDVFAALAKSDFRRRFKLGPKERRYLEERGLDAILQHARKIFTDRLGPVWPEKDGKQTPMRGHPVFLAQHATATCCRGCLEKWHAIPRGKELTDEEKEHMVEAVRRWLLAQGFREEPRLL